jgi:hypothetical protein
LAEAMCALPDKRTAMSREQNRGRDHWRVADPPALSPMP